MSYLLCLVPHSHIVSLVCGRLPSLCSSPGRPRELAVCISIGLNAASEFLQWDFLEVFLYPRPNLFSHLILITVLCYMLFLFPFYKIDEETLKIVELNPPEHPLSRHSGSLFLLYAKWFHLLPVFFPSSYFAFLGHKCQLEDFSSIGLHFCPRFLIFGDFWEEKEVDNFILYNHECGSP